MAANDIPRTYDPLVQLGEDAADGAANLGETVGVKQNTEAAIRADVVALTGTPAPTITVAQPKVPIPQGDPGLKALYNAAKANKSNMTAALRTANSNGRALAMACIGTLKPVLGTQWNSQWNAAGFTDGSIAVPANPMVKLQQLRAYYNTNPNREVPDVNGITCTAAGCEAAAQAISTASENSNQSNTDAGTAQANLEAGIATLRRRLTGLREELTQLLDDTDERWYAFGFDRPGDLSTPEVPANVTATPGAPASRMLFVHWDDARRADGYRVLVVNVATKLEIANQLAQDAEATLSDLPAAATVSITVTARNAAGESQPSDAVQIVVP